MENPTSPASSELHVDAADAVDPDTADSTTPVSTEPWLPPLAPDATAPRPADTPAGENEPPPVLYEADYYDPQQTERDRPRRSQGGGFWVPLVAAIIGAALALGGAWLLGAFAGDEANGTTAPTTEREIITLSGDGTSPAAVGEKVTPSIVTVEVGGDRNGTFVAFGSGSGVVLSSDGLIATNHHVVEGSTAAQVVFQDGSIHEATLVGSDPVTDLAVLRVEAGDLVPIELGATGTLAIGDSAIAVGNPLGQRGGASLTVGVVSAFNRDVQVDADARLFGMLQTDAPITQGSSGGALVDNNGRLIGITTAIGVSSAGAEGIGYAIPVELMTRITDELIATGSVRHPFLGVRLEDSFEERGTVQIPNGAVVTGFVDGSTAAEDAGIEVGDVVIGFEGATVRTLDDLVNAIRLYRVGDSVTINVLSGGETVALPVTLGERPEDL